MKLNKRTLYKTICLAALSMLTFSFKNSNAQVENKIRWMSFEEAVAKCDKNPKKIFIDVYTDWCGWCKRMDNTTFKDTAVVRYMNDHFYAVKLDAETKDTIRFREKGFGYLAQYKANEIAVSLLGGNMGYPSFVYLDQNYSLIKAVPGYQTVEQLIPTLHFMVEEKYRDTPWEEFEKEIYKK